MYMPQNPFLRRITRNTKSQALVVIGLLFSSSSLVIVIFFLGFFLIMGGFIYYLTRGLPGSIPSRLYSAVSSYISGGSRKSYRGIDKALGKVTCYRTSSGTACDCSAIKSQLVTIDFMGRKIQVHRKAAPAFQAVVQDIKAAGIKYNFWDSSCAGDKGGAYNCRTIKPLKGTSTTPSPHAYGIAIDINPGCNPQTNKKNPCPSNLPPKVIQIFKKHGFRWGGDYKSKCDAMHFEWMGW